MTRQSEAAEVAAQLARPDSYLSRALRQAQVELTWRIIGKRDSTELLYCAAAATELGVFASTLKQQAKKDAQTADE